MSRVDSMSKRTKEAQRGMSAVCSDDEKGRTVRVKCASASEPNKTGDVRITSSHPVLLHGPSHPSQRRSETLLRDPGALAGKVLRTFTRPALLSCFTT